MIKNRSAYNDYSMKVQKEESAFRSNSRSSIDFQNETMEVLRRSVEKEEKDEWMREANSESAPETQIFHVEDRRKALTISLFTLILR